MNTSTRTSARHAGHYIHKLRLEAHEGAGVEAGSPLEPAARSYQASRILAKLVGATLVALSLLILIASGA